MSVIGHQQSGWTKAFIIDISVTLGALAFATLAVVVEIGGPLQIIAAIAIALFFPGYAFTTALFPANEPSSVSGAAGLRPLGRLGLTLGFSVVGVTAIALGFGIGEIEFDVLPLLISLVGATVLLFVVGMVRRVRLPVQHRYVLPVGALIGPRLAGRSSFDTVLSAGLLVVVVLSVMTFGYALAAPQDGTNYTSVRLLTELPSGEMTAAGYKTNYESGEKGSYVLAIQNQEHRPITYNVVVERQSVMNTEDGVTVTKSAELKSLEARVEHNETRYFEHTVQPIAVGENQRLVYLVYRNEPPANPSIETAYEYNYISITVTDR